MPFVDIRLAGNATHEQKAGIVADVTRSLVERLGKNPAAVPVVMSGVSLDRSGAGGVVLAARVPALAQAGEDAHAAVSSR